MRDKDRILMVIITRIIPALTYLCHNYEDKEQYVKSSAFDNNDLIKGDLVYANTTRYPNDFCVGFVDSVHPDKVVIREIGSSKLCNYSNESFTKINKEKLGYEILEGEQYKIYKKVMKAFAKYTRYGVRFHSIEFVKNKCIVRVREVFSNNIIGMVEFEYNSKTTIKLIGELLRSSFGN